MLLLLSVAFLQSTILAYAQPDTTHHSVQRVSESERFIIRYKLSSTKVEENTLDNEENLARISNYLKNSPRIDSITIYSYASPEGSYLFNKKLSEGRGRSAKEYLLSQIPADRNFDPDKIIIDPTPENWVGLRELVEERYFRYDREKLLRILDDNSVGTETKKWRIQQLNEGYTWKIILRDYMPLLRYSTWICVWVEVIDPLPRVEAVHSKAMACEIPLPERKITPVYSAPEIVEPLVERVPIAALSTNLLVPGLNFAAEMPVGDRWSVGADYYFPWFWPKKDNRNCFELLGWSVEGRYWFGKDRRPENRLRGHSLGVYASAGYYDFERNFKGQQGEYIGTGVDYTYAMPIGRKKRVNLEFTVALGYIHAWGKNYTVPGEFGQLYPEEGTVLFDYFGPTKAAVSIVVPLYRKEGRR